MQLKYMYKEPFRYENSLDEVFTNSQNINFKIISEIVMKLPLVVKKNLILIIFFPSLKFLFYL